MSSSHILEICTLSDIGFASIFSHSMGLLFTLLFILLCRSLFSLMQFCLFIFNLLVVLLRLYPRNICLYHSLVGEFLTIFLLVVSYFQVLCLILNTFWIYFCIWYSVLPTIYWRVCCVIVYDCTALETWSKLIDHEFIWGLPILFHWSLSLFLYQGHVVMITMTL